MSVSPIDPNQAKINALSQAPRPATVAKHSKTAQKGNEGSKTDSVTISKEARAAASQVPTRASDSPHSANCTCATCQGQAQLH